MNHCFGCNNEIKFGFLQGLGVLNRAIATNYLQPDEISRLIGCLYGDYYRVQAFEYDGIWAPTPKNDLLLSIHQVS